MQAWRSHKVLLNLELDHPDLFDHVRIHQAGNAAQLGLVALVTLECVQHTCADQQETLRRRPQIILRGGL